MATALERMPLSELENLVTTHVKKCRRLANIAAGTAELLGNEYHSKSYPRCTSLSGYILNGFQGMRLYHGMRVDGTYSNYNIEYEGRTVLKLKRFWTEGERIKVYAYRPGDWESKLEVLNKMPEGTVKEIYKRELDGRIEQKTKIVEAKVEKLRQTKKDVERRKELLAKAKELGLAKLIRPSYHL